MCNPALLAVGAMAMSAVATVQQNKAIEEAAQVQQDQISEQAAERTNTRMEEARALRSSMRAAAAESAVSGNSVELLGNDIMGQAGRDVALIEKNRRNGVVASATEARGRVRSSTAEGVAGIYSAGAAAYGNHLNYQKYGIPGD